MRAACAGSDERAGISSRIPKVVSYYKTFVVVASPVELVFHMLRFIFFGFLVYFLFFFLACISFDPLFHRVVSPEKKK